MGINTRDSTQRFAPFAFFVGAGALLLSVLLARLVEVQLVNGDWYRQRADENRFFSVTVPAERGVLLDRYGEPLVYNKRVYWSVVNPDALHSDLEPLSREAALLQMATSSSSVQFTIERAYRYGESLAPVLGYTGLASVAELEADRSLSPQTRIGKTGLEKTLDAQLRGRSGLVEYEINAQGQKQHERSRTAPQPGRSIATTVDPYLSVVAYQALGGKKGAVVITDVSTGEILVSVSSPSYNPAVFSTDSSGVSAKLRNEYIQQLFTDERKLFFNRVVAGAYPPGSVFKMVTALAGLEQKTMTADTTVLDEGVLKVGEFEYANWYYTQFGRTEGLISLVRALARSNDIYFYKAAESVGPTKLAEYARIFGFGKVTDVELPGEVPGLVPDPVWKERNSGERWFLGNTYHFGIGQGDIAVTPLQVTQLTQALGNRGVLCQPHILSQQNGACAGLGLDDENIRLVLRGMLSACSLGGTAYPLFGRNTQLGLAESTEDPFALFEKGALACKTGTAEFGASDERGYRRTHGWLTALISIPSSELTDSLQSQTQESQLDQQAQVSATVSASLDTSMANLTIEPASVSAQLRTVWLAKVAEHGFPKSIAITVLVESDAEQPYREGSRDAGPVVAQLFEWMIGRKLSLPPVDDPSRFSE